jgi:precorrin-4/cobalt-precorrin-4 C11-methyltransferase
MKVYFVGAGPGDPELLTLRAARLLSCCRICIYAGSLVSPAVMELVNRNAMLYDSAGMNLDEIIAVCLKAREDRTDVVRLHSGDPSIYGAIREQMSALDKAGISYEVVPGVSAFQAAAAALNVELTAPEVAQTVILTRTSGRTPLPKEQELTRLAATQATLCIFLSGHKIAEVARILEDPYGGDCPAAVVYHASWPDQKIVTGTLTDIAGRAEAAGIGQTSLILVGRALGRDIAPSKLYDKAFTHGFRKGEPS